MKRTTPVVDDGKFAHHPPGQKAAYIPPPPAANNNAMTPDQFSAHIKNILGSIPMGGTRRDKPKED